MHVYVKICVWKHLCISQLSLHFSEGFEVLGNQNKQTKFVFRGPFFGLLFLVCQAPQDHSKNADEAIPASLRGPPILSRLSLSFFFFCFTCFFT